MSIKHLFFLFIIVVVVPASTLASCGIFKGATQHYDLSSLTTNAYSPWSAVDTTGDYKFYWNFCANLEHIPVELSQTGPVPVIQVAANTGIGYTVGLLDGYVISERAPNVISVNYVASRPQDICIDWQGRQVPRKTSIIVECASGSDGVIVSVAESPSQICSYDIVMKHKAACGIPSSCGIFQGATLTYDLSSLTVPASKPWTATDIISQYTYYWNFCVNLEDGLPQVPVPVLQIANVPVLVGLLDGYQISEKAPNVITVKYTNPGPIDLCRDSNGALSIARNTTITVECEPGSEGSVVSVTEPVMCKYDIVMKHKAACGRGPTPNLPLCCVYSSANDSTIVSTFCIANQQCPEFKTLRYEGQFNVDNCTSCKKGLAKSKLQLKD